MKQPVKIPTIFALILILLLLGGLVGITEHYLRKPTNADAGKIPKDVTVTNISDSGFTLTWRTEKPTKGIIEVVDEGGKTPKPFFDERHTPGNIGAYTMHSVPVRSLNSNTVYKITILEHEGGSLGNQIYHAKTGPLLTLESNTLGPAYGTIVKEDGTPAEGAIVYLTLDGSQKLSTLVKPSGSFLIPLNLIRTEDLSSYIRETQPPLPIMVTVLFEDKQALAQTTTANAAPVPEIILGKTYDFRTIQGKKKESQEVAALPTTQVAKPATSFANVLGSASNFIVRLTSPGQGAHVTSPYPLIAGTGIPNAYVTITLGMQNPQVGSVLIAEDGTWNFSPKKAVGIGNQSVTITTVDKDKKPVAITHLFEIMKSGTQVLGVATPSGTPVITGTPIPTLPIGPTATSSPTPTLPITGTAMPSLTLFVFGLLFFFFGAVVFLIS